MKVIIFFSFFLYFTDPSLTLAKDQVDCTPVVVKSELLTLLGTVKNDILGNLPRFCRPDEYKQLAEQVDPAEMALGQFVESLTKANIGQKDSIELNSDDEVDMDTVVFNTTKMVVLKKMFKNFSEDDQISLLTSAECGLLGLNRFPMQKKQLIAPVHSEAAFKKNLNVCKATEFSEIAPYISQDVMAEALFNLKNVFPQSFPKLVTTYCANLSDTDELIFKTNQYSDFSNNELHLANAENFSSWLKELYDGYANNSQNGYYKTPSVTESFKKEQKKLAEYYELKKEQMKDGGVPYGYEGLLVKNDKGIFYIKDSAETIAQKKKQKEMHEEWTAKSYQQQAEYTQVQLKNYFEKGNSPEEGAPYPGSSGLVVKKDNNGKYYVAMKDDHKEKYLDAIKSHLNASKMTSQVLTAKLGKQLFEIQLKYGDHEEGRQAFIKKYGYIIVKDKEGKYTREHVYSDAQSTVLLKIFEANKINSDDEVVYSGYGNNFLVKNEKGIITQVPFYMLNQNPEKNENYKEQQAYQKAEAYLVQPTLNMTATKKYQEKATDHSKIKSLTPDEMEQVHYYTGSGYGAMNSCLRSEKCSPVQKKNVETLVRAIEKIRTDSGKKVEDRESLLLFRGASGLPSFIKENLEKNPKDFVLDKGFMSTSASLNVAKSFASAAGKIKGNSYLFVIKAKSCTGVDAISASKGEDEFLCPPGMKFNVRKKEGDENIYILEEAGQS